MLNLDPSKLLVIAVVMVIVLGPDKLPQVARQVGGAWRAISDFRLRMESEVRSSMPDLPSATELATYARSPAALLERLAAPEPAHETSIASLDAGGELPVLGLNGDEHWTMKSHGDQSNVDAVAEKVWLEAQAPFAGDATLN